MLFGKILCGMKFHTKCYEVNKIILENSTWAWKAISACLNDSSQDLFDLSFSYEH